ncbi:conserved hypothetical protein Msm_1434 [Methanobrevibacter smithii ATCC 35061]|uniref:Uncharacterized protein n=1 Tax=Methanobrevibacter smithii (strain ATCC 35061 / DSM 861 / OCM 144 / PS) TaxID=420247 RepID=A5UN61_METS3|nr:conserved hypothetical protein Msm_1434 [Methanobrevibacter smithii ATCC 35061]
MLYDAAAALATAMETATVVLPPIAERLSVPSTSLKTSSIVAISSASIPISSEAIMSSISLTITSTPPSGNDTTSLEPVLAPLGAAALPNPFQVITSTSTVGFPLLSKILRTWTSSIILSKKNTSVSINLLPYNLYS